MRDRKFHVPQFEVGTPARFVVTNLNHEQPCLKELNDFGAEFVAAPHCRNKHHFLISRDAYLVGLKALPRKHSARKLMFRELSNNSKNHDDVRRKANHTNHHLLHDFNRVLLAGLRIHCVLSSAEGKPVASDPSAEDRKPYRTLSAHEL